MSKKTTKFLVTTALIIALTCVATACDKNSDQSTEGTEPTETQTVSLEDVQNVVNSMKFNVTPVKIEEVNKLKTTLANVVNAEDVNANVVNAEDVNIENAYNAETRRGQKFMMFDIVFKGENGNEEKKSMDVVGTNLPEIDGDFTDEQASKINEIINNLADKIDILRQNNMVSVNEYGESSLVAAKKESVSPQILQNMNGVTTNYNVTAAVDIGDKLFVPNDTIKYYAPQFMIDDENKKVYILGIGYNENGEEVETDEYPAYSVPLSGKDGDSVLDIIDNSINNANEISKEVVSKEAFDDKEGVCEKANLILVETSRAAHKSTEEQKEDPASVNLTKEEAQECGLVDQDGNVVDQDQDEEENTEETDNAEVQTDQQNASAKALKSGRSELYEIQY